MCGFLGLPAYSLDGKTRLSTMEVFEVLTKTSVFFMNYDEKYKIKERRKRRPVSDVFFSLLETSVEDLEGVKCKLYMNDDMEELFRKVRRNEIGYEEYIEQISEYFNIRDEVASKLLALLEKNNQQKRNPKFNFQVLCSWFPEVEQNTVGRILAKVKNKHSGTGTDAFDDWINKTEIEMIRVEAEKSKNILLTTKKM